MTVTISLYNHTAARFASGANAVGDTYRVMLCTSATFDATNTTLASITKSETVNGNGYTTGGQALSNVAVSTVTTNDAKFDADDLDWTATGGSITAGFAILYNDTDADDPPVAFIDFGGAQSAGSGTLFRIAWNTAGIITWTAP